MENSNGLIYGKISQIMRECPAIGKNNRNQQQNFNYRSIDDVMNALQNILPKYGVFYVPEVLESTREERQTKTGGNLIYSILKVKYTFYAEDGSNIAAVVQSEGMDSADKSSNKAMSAACKYALFQVFNIPTKEMVDPDATTPEESFQKPQTVQRPQQTAQPVKQSQAQQPAPQFRTVKYPGNEILLKTFELPDGFQTVMTLADANAMMDSQGESYGEKSLETLYYTLDALLRRVERNNLSATEREQIQDKIDAIYLIYDNAKKQSGY